MVLYKSLIIRFFACGYPCIVDIMDNTIFDIKKVVLSYIFVFQVFLRAQNLLTYFLLNQKLTCNNSKLHSINDKYGVIMKPINISVFES